MTWRKLIGFLALTSTVGISACSGGGSGIQSTPTATATQTPTATLTATQTATSTPTTTPTMTPSPVPPQAGDVLIAGGLTAGNNRTQGMPIASAEFYDPTAGAFRPTNNMTTARAEHFAILLETGDTLVACGDQFDLTADLYATPSGSFSATGGTTVACPAAAATLLDNGQVLVTGGGIGLTTLPTPVVTPVGFGAGLIPPYDTQQTAQLYDPTKGSFSNTTGGMTTDRLLNTATLLNDGTALVAGGSSDPYFDGVQKSAEIFSPSMGTFAATGSMNSHRAAHTATLLGNGQVLVTGGIDNTGVVLSSAETFVSGVFTPTAGAMTTARGGHRATLLASGKVLLTGGIDASGTPLASAELFDPASGTFTATGSMKTARFNHVAVLLNDGTVLVAGGSGGVSSLNSSEIFDPASGTFTSQVTMATARSLAAGALLK